MTDKHRARLMLRDQSQLIRLGSAKGAKILAPFLKIAIRHFRDGRDPTPIILQGLDKLKDTLVTLMESGHSAGVSRTKTNAPLKLSFSSTTTFLKKKAKLTEAQVIALEAQYSVEAARVIPKLKGKVDKALRAEIEIIGSQGLTTRDGIIALKKSFVNIGLVPKSNHAIEAVFRTQTQIAYSAGRWDAEQSPEIQEILWGYKYVTVGDDRVRDEHAALDGTTLPKDDPFWDVAYPPNGWNCRCQVISVFEKREIKRPTGTAEIAPGFDFNPGKLFATIK